MKSNVTVGDMIRSLSQFPADAPLEIAVRQFNKVHPVAYAAPHESAWVKASFASMRNGQDVRIEISLPYDDSKYMMVSERKR